MLKLSRPEQVIVQVGNPAHLKAYLRNSSGNSAVSTGPVTIVFDQLVREFDDFLAIAQTGATQSWMKSPGAGTPTGVTGNYFSSGVTDESWIPGIHGSEGYNVQLLLPADLIDSVGWYRYRALLEGDIIQDWNIGVRG